MKNKFNNLAIIGGDNHLPLHAYKSVKKKFKNLRKFKKYDKDSSNSDDSGKIISAEDGLHALSFVSGRDMEVLLWSLQIYNLKQ